MPCHAMDFVQDVDRNLDACVKVLRWYNARPYGARGWCTLESAASREVATLAAFLPTVAAALARLPPKLVDMSGPEPLAVEEAADAAGAGPRVEAVRAALRDPAATQFTRPADRALVVRLYSQAAARFASAMVHAADALGGADPTAVVYGRRERRFVGHGGPPTADTRLPTKPACEARQQNLKRGRHN